MKKFINKTPGWIAIGFGIMILFLDFFGKGSFSFVMLLVGLALTAGGWYWAKPADKNDKDFYEEKKKQGNLYENVQHIEGKFTEDSILLAGDTDFIVVSDRVYIFASDSFKKIAEVPFEAITYLWAGMIEDKGMDISSMTKSAHLQRASLTGQSIVGTAVAVAAVDKLTESWFQHHILKLNYQESDKPRQLAFESKKNININNDILKKMSPTKLSSLQQNKKPSAVTNNSDAAEQLKKLSDLKVSGVISDKEFEDKKKELLARM